MKTISINRSNIILSILSGFLLTCSFPKIGIDRLAWFALVPLLISLKNSSLTNSFRLGFLAGLAHYITLVYWLFHTMQTYGHLPFYLCVSVLFLLASYLSLYLAVFSIIVKRLCSKPVTCLFIIPFSWVALEYIRNYLFSGFPWGLIGYSQFNRLHLIQISDIFGIYGVSFLIALANATIFLTFLYITKSKWKEIPVKKRLAGGSISVFVLMICIVFIYGKWRIESIDNLISASKSLKVTIVQGNIEQSIKWNPAFQTATTEKYVNLSLSAKEEKPDLVVWPETATPFYFLYDRPLSEKVQKGIHDTNTNFLIGSPSFVRGESIIEYYNSAYLMSPDGRVCGKYDKTHLVPFGEYVPFKKWLPFIGKMVEAVGDFSTGQKGKTIKWNNYNLGLLICYEIIFPELSGAMAKNDATLLVNITNDAWYGRTSAPYQHFSMAVFRAIENRRSLIRAANTGISGFIDPVGRIIDSTSLFQEKVITRSVPIIHKTSIYTGFGDLFAIACLIVMLIFSMRLIYITKIRRKNVYRTQTKYK
ncbi:MAG: apolipoprotein N-acyltransferase [Deltaproteobacteria bacterium]|nr:apolipoprotein N-acyltransferase [Deltaproteobacteria bacterium]